MAQKFPTERASMALAEADIFGDRAVLKKYGIDKTTLWRWRNRAAVDAELHQNATLKKKMLLAGWQDDATRCLKSGLARLTEIIPDAGPTDADVIHAIAGAVKIVGELKISYDALID